MVKRALVVDSDENTAELKIKRECACSNSANCEKSCFTLSEDTIYLKAANIVGAKTGDIVELSAKSPLILLYAFCIFILPLMLAFAAYIILSSFEGKSVFLYIIPIGLFIISVCVAAILLNRHAKKRNVFKISRIV